MRKSFSMRYPPTHLEVETSDSSPSTSDSIDFCAICLKKGSRTPFHWEQLLVY